MVFHLLCTCKSSFHIILIQIEIRGESRPDGCINVKWRKAKDCTCNASKLKEIPQCLALISFKHLSNNCLGIDPFPIRRRMKFEVLTVLKTPIHLITQLSKLFLWKRLSLVYVVYFYCVKIILDVNDVKILLSRVVRYAINITSAVWKESVCQLC